MLRIFRQRHIKLRQWMRQSFTTGLDVGLFSCPTAKEGRIAFCWRKFAKRSLFRSRKKSFRDFLDFEVCPNSFYVHANGAIPAKREGHQTIRVRHVEGQLLPRWVREVRLAVTGVCETNLVRRNSKVRTQHRPQPSAGQDELVAIFIEVEARSPLRFVL